jgi:hypothetical protein
MEIQKKHNCVCEKSYVHASSLCVHRQKCSVYLKQNPKKQNEEINDIQSISSIGQCESRVCELEMLLKLSKLEMAYELKLKDQEIANQLKLKELELENQKLKFHLEMKELEIILLKKIEQVAPVAPVAPVVPVSSNSPVVSIKKSKIQITPVEEQVALVVPVVPVSSNSPVASIKKSKIQITPVEEPVVEPTSINDKEDDEIPSLKQSAYMFCCNSITMLFKNSIFSVFVANATITPYQNLLFFFG